MGAFFGERQLAQLWKKSVTFSAARKEEPGLGGGIRKRTVWSWHGLWKRGPVIAVAQEELRIFLK